MLVSDIREGVAGSSPNDLTATTEGIVFRAAAAEGDAELWTSNGNSAGTRLVKDIRAGAGASSPKDFMINPVTGVVLFTADDGVVGDELWMTNGTADGTALVSDIAPGAASSSPALVGTVGTSTVFRTTSVGSSALRVMQTSGLGVVLSGTPSLTGSTVVGGALSVSTGLWEALTSFGYQWLRDGAPIAGATGAAYQLTPADLGRAISVRVTGSKLGNISVTKTTSSVGVGAGAIALAPTPKIKGAAKVGRTLKVVKATYEPGAVVSRQWLRNGKAIKGSAAKKASYKLRKADQGKRIQVRVTVSKPGHTTIVKTSKKTSKVKASKKSSKGKKK
jgi:ELWxxDGT repeat protein